MKLSHHEQSNDIVYVALDEHEQQRIFDAAADIYPYMQQLPEAAAVEVAETIGRTLVNDNDPRLAQLSEFLQTTKTHRQDRAVVIEGLVNDSDYIAPTPDHHLSPEEYELLLPQARRLIVLGMMGVYGYGYSKRQQPGTIQNEVIAVPEYFETSGISANPNEELGLHIEDTYLNLGEIDGSPDWLTIFMLRNPDHVPTTLSFPHIQALRDVEPLLWDEAYAVTTNAANYNEDDPTHFASILYGTVVNPFYRINLANFDRESCDPTHLRAVDMLSAHVDQQKVALDLKPGDLLLVDNRRVLHGRALYGPDQMPKWNGLDRYQTRVIAADDAARIQQYESESRLVDPDKILSAAQSELVR